MEQNDISKKIIDDLKEKIKKDLESNAENNFERLYDEAKDYYEKKDLENALLSMINLTRLLDNNKKDINPKERRFIQNLKEKSREFIKTIKRDKNEQVD